MIDGSSISLPRLDGVRQRYSAVGVDCLAARCALELVDQLPVQPQRSQQYFEQATLTAMLESWLAVQCRGLRVQDPVIKIVTGRTAFEPHEPDDARIYVHVGNRGWNCWHSQWHLQPAWEALERSVPGLARTALAVLEHASPHALYLYTPLIAASNAERFWDWQEDTDEGRDPDPDALTREQFRAAIPEAVSSAREVLRVPQLERLARRRDNAGQVARQVLELRAAVKRECRRRDRVELHHGEEGFGAECLGWAVTLRWNGRDPMERIYHDYGQSCSENDGYFESFFFAKFEPGELRDWMRDMERRFAVARLVDGLVPLIATSQR